MVIKKTKSKYRVGCGRGQNKAELPNLLYKLNLILDKKGSGLEDDVELRDGDVFELDGTILAVDGDNLVQIVSESGPLAVKRLLDEVICPEILLSEKDISNYSFKWEEVDSLPAEFEKVTPSYPLMRIWNKIFVENRLSDTSYVKINLTDEIGLDYEVYLKGYDAYIRKSDFLGNDDFALILEIILSFFYQDVERIYVETKEEEVENDSAECIG